MGEAEGGGGSGVVTLDPVLRRDLAAHLLDKLSAVLLAGLAGPEGADVRGVARELSRGALIFMTLNIRKKMLLGQMSKRDAVEALEFLTDPHREALDKVLYLMRQLALDGLSHPDHAGAQAEFDKTAYEIWRRLHAAFGGRTADVSEG